MNANEYLELVKSLTVGKSTPNAIYIHKSAISEKKLTVLVEKLLSAVKHNDFSWNIIKLWKMEFKISILSYPSFEQDAYPELRASIHFNLEQMSHRLVQYQDNDNPPILHRKDQMVGIEYPLLEEFKQITEEGEQAGLYEKPNLIGFKLSWLSFIESKGFELVDGRLFRRSSILAESQKIERHKTAINRYSLSTPMQLLKKKGYLSGEYSIFDYGCGLGDDLAQLHANGIEANGWDPNFRPDFELLCADIVNLGFVLNVIEDITERVEAIQNAFSLANKFLIVSCMLGSESHIAKFKPYKDGIITSRNTFQKYYTQEELRQFIDACLERESLAVGSGIFIIFKDLNEEQIFLSNKYRSTKTWKEPNLTKNNELKETLLLEDNKELVAKFASKLLSLARVPLPEEFSELEEINSVFGSSRKLFNLLMKKGIEEQFHEAQNQRKEDYLVYFALESFSRRKPYREMPSSMRSDLKSLFTKYSDAKAQGENLLFQISDAELLIEYAEKVASKSDQAVYVPKDCLLISAQIVDTLPALLRTYVGAAAVLYGDWEEADIIKIHLGSGKVSFMVYDDFETSIPFLKERVKVKLAQQSIEYYDYLNPQRRPPLLGKSSFLSNESDSYKKQLSLDKRLSEFGMLKSNSENCISRFEWNSFLERNNITIKGFRIFGI